MAYGHLKPGNTIKEPNTGNYHTLVARFEIKGSAFWTLKDTNMVYIEDGEGPAPNPEPSKRFKKGDSVQCINAGGAEGGNGSIDLGRHYVVEAMYGANVALEGVFDAWDSERFKLVTIRDEISAGDATPAGVSVQARHGDATAPRPDPYTEHRSLEAKQLANPDHRVFSVSRFTKHPTGDELGELYLRRLNGDGFTADKVPPSKQKPAVHPWKCGGDDEP